MDDQQPAHQTREQAIQSLLNQLAITRLGIEDQKRKHKQERGTIMATVLQALWDCDSIHGHTIRTSYEIERRTIDEIRSRVLSLEESRRINTPPDQATDYAPLVIISLVAGLSVTLRGNHSVIFTDLSDLDDTIEGVTK